MSEIKKQELIDKFDLAKKEVAEIANQLSPFIHATSDESEKLNESERVKFKELSELHDKKVNSTFRLIKEMTKEQILPIDYVPAFLLL